MQITIDENVKYQYCVCVFNYMNASWNRLRYVFLVRDHKVMHIKYSTANFRKHINNNI